MLRGVGLQERPARPVAPSRPAAGLGQELVGALGGPQIPTAQAEVGVHHPHQGQARKIVALGRGLGGDQDVIWPSSMACTIRRAASASKMVSDEKTAIRASGNRSRASSSTRSSAPP